MILEDGKFYPMMKVVPGEKEHICTDTPYTLSEPGSAVCFWSGIHPVLKEYLRKESSASAMRSLINLKNSA